MSFPDRKVYLAGPITGLSYGEARHGWREEFARLLPAHIHPHSPMRAKDFLIDQNCLTGDPNMYPDNAIATASGIVTRDRNDIKRECDAMVACFLGATKASIGTSIEYGWADLDIPIVMVIEDEGRIILPGEPEDSRLLRDIVARLQTQISPKERGHLLALASRIESDAGKNPHWHAMLTEIAGYRVSTIEEAAHIVTHLLTPGF